MSRDSKFVFKIWLVFVLSFVGLRRLDANVHVQVHRRDLSCDHKFVFKIWFVFVLSSFVS